MKNEYLEIEKGLFDQNSISEYWPSIHLEDIERDPKFLVSEHFLKQDELKKEIFNTDINIPEFDFYKDKRYTEDIAPIGSDAVVIRGWKTVENISCRLIDYFGETVILECLIDKELGIYEEREFRISLFEDYKIEIGNLFLLRIFERQNEIKMEIHNDPDLIYKDDFPKMSFVEKFKESSIFKKK